VRIINATTRLIGEPVTTVNSERLTTSSARQIDTGHRLAPWTGIAFVVAFAVGVVASSPPSTGASNAKWLAQYTKAHAAGHITSGVALVVAGLCFALFVLGLWDRIVARGTRPSPIPLVAAAITAACMGIGGLLMAIPGVLVSGGAPVPNADLLRFCDTAGFGAVGVPGMLAAAIAVVALGVQARKAAIFGQKLFIYSVVTGVALLGAVEFLPIAFLLVWLVIAAVHQLRHGDGAPADARG
jgi:hypothetical protein